MGMKKVLDKFASWLPDETSCKLSMPMKKKQSNKKYALQTSVSTVSGTIFSQQEIHKNLHFAIFLDIDGNWKCSLRKATSIFKANRSIWQSYQADNRAEVLSWTGIIPPFQHAGQMVWNTQQNENVYVRACAEKINRCTNSSAFLIASAPSAKSQSVSWPTPERHYSQVSI